MRRQRFTAGRAASLAHNPISKRATLAYSSSAAVTTTQRRATCRCQIWTSNSIWPVFPSHRTLTTSVVAYAPRLTVSHRRIGGRQARAPHAAERAAGTTRPTIRGSRVSDHDRQCCRAPSVRGTTRHHHAAPIRASDLVGSRMMRSSQESGIGPSRRTWMRHMPRNGRHRRSMTPMQPSRRRASCRVSRRSGRGRSRLSPHHPSRPRPLSRSQRPTSLRSLPCSPPVYNRYVWMYSYSLVHTSMRPSLQPPTAGSRPAPWPAPCRPGRRPPRRRSRNVHW